MILAQIFYETVYLFSWSNVVKSWTYSKKKEKVTQRFEKMTPGKVYFIGKQFITPFHDHAKII